MHAAQATHVAKFSFKFILCDHTVVSTDSFQVIDVASCVLWQALGDQLVCCRWEDSGYFQPADEGAKPPFVMAMCVCLTRSWHLPCLCFV